MLKKVNFLLFFLVLCLFTSGVLLAEVFINEIHYDNVSTDIGEAIEVAGSAGTDLTGWSIVLYNGSNNSVYNTTDLSGVIPDQDNGFGTVSIDYPSNGIQNGAPDAIALVNSSDTVVQFLSYEGSLTAVGGPADGLTSTDIGVAETSSTVAGNSLQLIGEGSIYLHFTWADPAISSFGAVNAGQTFGGGEIPDSTIVINEVDADTDGTDTLEFVELYDGGSGNTSLDGLVVVFYNGSSDTSYQTLGLDGFTTDADGYFLLGNALVVPAPSIVFSDNGLQNGADAIAIYNGIESDYPNGTAVTTENLMDAVVYDSDDADDTGLLVLLNEGQPQINENESGSKATDSIQRCPNGSGGARNTETYSTNIPSPGTENCGDVVTFSFIHEIQGNGSASPVAGTLHTIEGVVVGDFQDTATELKGFFLQEEDTDADADPMTSEGILVFDNGFGVDVSVGDVVSVTGTVVEYYDFTELTSVTAVEIVGTGAVAPTEIMLPVSALTDWEQYEGMLITFSQTLYASGNYSLGRYGEVDLSVNSRLLNPTNVVTPGAEAIAMLELNDRSRIQLEDGSTVSNPEPYPPYLYSDNTLRAGDTVDNLTGVLGYGFGSYELHPTEEVSFARVNERTDTPQDVGGSLKVASFNVLNYFTTLDGNGKICGPTGGMDCRGADSPEEFIRQRDKIISAITAMRADVIGLMEMENNPTDEALIDLVNGLNAIDGAGTYSLVNSGVVGTDAIKVALIYRVATVTPVGSPAVLDSSVDPDFDDTKNRPALAQTFQQISTGEAFTAVVNHLKSKGSSCESIGDPDTGDGQGNCNLTRTKAATALVNWLTTDPTGSGDEDVIILGDLNAYAMEDPVTAIKAGGYTNLLQLFVGEDAYSYVYYGQAGYLDHALASESLTAQVTGVTEWHINADEPAALDYNDFNQDALYMAGPFRASDHDPVLIGLELAPPNNSSIGNYVWNDENSDGIQDAGEAGLADVTVNLYSGEHALVASTLTDENGMYLFESLFPGDYQVEVIVPVGFLISPMDQGADDALDSDVDLSGITGNVTLASSEDNRDIDAGLFMPAASDICSYLGDNASWIFPDIDVFTFEGKKGEKVAVTLKVNPDGSNQGKKATLILIDDIHGVYLWKSKQGKLPRTIKAKLPADGKYKVIVLEHSKFMKKNGFEGDYCLSVEADSNPVLEPTPWVE